METFKAGQASPRQDGLSRDAKSRENANEQLHVGVDYEATTVNASR
jgi:hypothetical protein